VFRKQKSPDSAETTEAPAPELDAAQAAKGRPTPTRREAEEARKARLTGKAGTGDAKADKRAQRQRDFAASTERQHGGPVKQFARDYVDSRFRIAEFFIIFAVLLFVVASVPSVALLSVVLWLVMLVAIVFDSVLLVRGVKKEARKRFPNADLGRLGWYSLMRSMQFRKWRLPKPRLKRGEKF
jgi:Flp pilus assembly protein TadB